ncbi:MAG: hypothetical protein QME66_08240 [Candidatus Eisenbacteria bacterium]|nr:hypothetical protein [Candidatus Eisenbacteria bacterium]
MADVAALFDRLMTDPDYTRADQQTQKAVLNAFVEEFGTPPQMQRAPSTGRGILSSALETTAKTAMFPLRAGGYIGEKTGLMSPETAEGLRETAAAGVGVARDLPLKPGSGRPGMPSYLPEEIPTTGQEIVGGILGSALPAMGVGGLLSKAPGAARIAKTAAKSIKEARKLGDYGAVAGIAGARLIGKPVLDLTAGAAFGAAQGEDVAKTAGEWALGGAVGRGAIGAGKALAGLYIGRKVAKVAGPQANQAMSDILGRTADVIEQPWTVDVMKSAGVDPLKAQSFRALGTSIETVLGDKSGQAGSEFLSKGLKVQDYVNRGGRGIYVESGFKKIVDGLKRQDNHAIINAKELGTPLPKGMEKQIQAIDEIEGFMDRLSLSNGVVTKRKDGFVLYETRKGHLPRMADEVVVGKRLKNNEAGEKWAKWFAPGKRAEGVFDTPEQLEMLWQDMVSSDVMVSHGAFQRGRQLPSLGAEFWEDMGFMTDLKRAYPLYIASTLRRIGALRAFGGMKDQEIVNAPLSALVQRAALPEKELLIKQMVSSGADEELVRKATGLLMGESLIPKADQAWLKWEGAYNALKLGRSAIINMPEISKGMVYFGAGDFMRGVRNVLKGADREALMDAQQVFRRSMQDMLSVNGALSRISEGYLKYTGFTPTDVVVRTFNNAAAKVYLDRQVKNLLSATADKAGRRQFAKAASALREARIDPDRVVRGGALSAFEKYQGVQRLVEEVQPVSEAHKLPVAWRSSALGVIASRFQGWGFQHSKHLYKLWKNDKVKALTETIAFGVPSAAAFELRRTMGDTARKERDRETYEYVFNPLAMTSVLGMAGMALAIPAEFFGGQEFVAQRSLLPPIMRDVVVTAAAPIGLAIAMMSEKYTADDVRRQGLKALRQAVGGVPTPPGLPSTRSMLTPEPKERESGFGTVGTF